ncbi:HxlR family transcriptional regulator [Mobilisporobacter senegalensis]|uniref:HxlR family transcriptional regulator n=1 Tax=Mobilisporobacter senegalensis TaxID=1329262 RepID=A0A3N1XGP6_9FIRM|nr:HxlR family transcriptional regulator [Mobilisporobacter senegalensis]
MEINQKDLTEICPAKYTLDILGGKWKILILWHLLNDGVKRYGEIKRVLPGITHKMLSNQLKELEADGIIHREEYHQIPPKVEYSLTERGMTLKNILNEISKWGNINKGSY